MSSPGTISVKFSLGVMAKVPNAVEILPKISTAWLGCTSVTDRQTTDGRAIAYSERERELTFANYAMQRKMSSWNGHYSSFTKLSWSRIALKRWIRMESRWIKKLVSVSSPDWVESLRVSSIDVEWQSASRWRQQDRKCDCASEKPFVVHMFNTTSPNPT